MKKHLFLIVPLSVLALAACNKSETPAADAANAEGGATAAAPAEPIALPPAITSSTVYRCKDGSVVHVDILGKSEAADIRVGDKNAVAVRVEAPKAEVPAAGTAATAAPAEAKPAGPMKSADGKAMLSINGNQINVKLADKGAQSCKS